MVAKPFGSVISESNDAWAFEVTSSCVFKAALLVRKSASCSVSVRTVA